MTGYDGCPACEGEGTLTVGDRLIDCPECLEIARDLADDRAFEQSRDREW